MRIGGLVILLLALGLAGGVAFLVDEWMTSQQAQVAAREAALEAKLEAERQRLAAQGPDRDKLLVAARNLEIGTMIGEDAVRQSEIMPEERPSGAFSYPDQVIGRMIRREVKEGEPIRSADLEREKKFENLILIRGTKACETKVGSDCQ